MLSHEHRSSTLWEGVSSACELLHPAIPSTSWWEPGNLAPALALTDSPLQKTTAHLKPADRLLFPPFQHMPSLPPSSTRYWHFCLATSPPGSYEGVVLHLCGPQRDPHARWTLLADATTPASVLLHAPPAHRRVGEMAQLGSSSSCPPGHTVLVCESYST